VGPDEPGASRDPRIGRPKRDPDSRSSQAGPLKGDANILIPVVPVDPQGGLKLYLRNLSDGGPPCRGGKAE
jgi:hypothetical protein